MANLNHEATSSDDFFYDVFLSFRGEGGTRYGFTDHLYNGLRQKGIFTFRDNEELRIGEEIRPSLFKAIENSRISMVVLCQNYASSTWCLDELTHIINCYDSKGKQVLVIFYKMKPSDLENSYAGTMREHESRFGQDSDKVKKWRKTLSRVRDLPGEYCKDDTDEAELIKKIVKDTSAKLPPIPLPIKHVVGLDSRFEQVKPLIDIESHDAVHMLEIYGAGGIGKTTFALDIYNRTKNQFEVACFLANVREKSNKSSKGLEDLQKTLLSEMGEDIETMIGSTFKGAFEIKRRLAHKRVLLVLDDVDSIEQLKALAGGRDWFGSGSRIIITTRDTTMLDKHEMDGVIFKKYKMEELNDSDSLELFCWHAFSMIQPEEKFEDVSSRVVSYAKGVPLALKVIGSNLKGGSLEDWEMELEKYRKIPNAEIQGILEISYNSLSELDQKTFLDIACFFKGERWEYVRRILKACDFFPIIRVYVSKCLITIDDNGCLDMHDLIQDMGREIVRKESPESPGDRSRLWSHKEVLQVLKENSGSNTIEGILLDPPSHEEVYRWNDTAFQKMLNLRILIVRNAVFSTGPSYLPNSLRVLEWKGYPSKSFPPNFYPSRIVDFKLPHSPLILQGPFQKFEDLTFINLSQCQSITQIPDMSQAINLRALTLDRCHKVVRFDKSFGFMPNLVYVSASECNMLKSFVPEMYLPSLKMLSFNFCKRLEHFPEVMQKMDKALKIHMINTAIKEFPKSIGNLVGLEYIDMSMCTRLNGLSNSFFLLPKLVTLIVDGCSQLGKSFERFKETHSAENGCPNLMTLHISEANLSYEHLHAILENFPKLEDLNVSHNNFVSLPKCIKGSSNLKSLDVSYCRNLKEIPELPSSIQKVDARYCRSLTTKASSVLWSKVCKDKERIQVVMPKTEIPNWFDYIGSEGIPFFWARGKFPVLTLAFVLGEVKETNEIQEDTFISQFLPGMMSDMSHIVGLHVFINGQEMCRKDYHYCNVGEDHVLLCDLKTLFNEQEWQGLEDACVGDNDWKAIQIQCESDLILSRWGIYMYKQKANTNDNDIRFKHPNSKNMPMSSPKRTPEMSKQRMRHMSENFNPREMFGDYLPLLESVETPTFTKALLRTWRNARADIRGEASASAYGASLMQEHEQSNWDVVRVVELVKENVPKYIADSFTDDIQSAHRIMEHVLRARVEFIREKGHDRLNIDMPIILEAPSRRYWGKLEIQHGDPTFKAVLNRTNQLSWSFYSENRENFHLQLQEKRMYMVLLKFQGEGEGEGESLEEEEYYDPVLEELLSRIEEDAMRLNKSYGKLKASIAPCTSQDFISDKYLIEGAYIRAQENMAGGNLQLGMLEMGLVGFGMMRGMPGLGNMAFNFEKTPYGKLRVEESTDQNQNNLAWPEAPMSCTIC